MSSHRITRTAGLALSIAALAAPTALASQSLVSPDAQDAAAGRSTNAPQSLVSPDAQDAAAGRGTSSALRNFVSPDAQDAAAGRGTSSAPEVTVIKVPAVPSDDSDGIRWTDAGIGAGGLLGIIALVGGTAMLVTHRPRHRSTAA